MRIVVKFFASYREAMETDEIEMDMQRDGRVSDLIEALKQQYPELGALSEPVIVAVNKEYASFDTGLDEGDVVAILPPVSGG